MNESIKTPPPDPINMRDERERRQTNTAKVIALLTARPKEWINATVFMELAGAMAWRTRISEARQVIERDGGKLENRQQRTSGVVVSEYRFLPYVPLASDAGVARSGQRSLDWNQAC